MNAWGFIAGGLVCALISAFFLSLVLFNGPTLVGGLIGWGFVTATVLLLGIGVVAVGVQTGRKG